MQDSFLPVGGIAGGACPSLTTDQPTFDEFQIAQAPMPGPVSNPPAGVYPIPSYDREGRPRLVTGVEAAQAAYAIAANAWEPSRPTNITTGRPGEGLRPYASLADRLAPYAAAPLDVVGAYGEIVFAADPSMNRLSQERYLQQAVAEAQRTPTGSRILNGLAAESGLPIVVRLNDQRFNAASFPEDATVSAPADSRAPAVRLRSNFDQIDWDPTSAPVSMTGLAAPPVMVLMHELRHAKQFAAERARSPASPDFPDGLIQQPAAFDRDVDADRNGIRDREDNATAVENIYLRELGLQPLRERYDSGIAGFLEVTGADVIPTDAQIQTFLGDWRRRNGQPGV